MSAAFDEEEILERIGDDRELLAELVVLLKEECDRLLPAIEEAIENDDPPALEQAAHKLKGSVGQMAARVAYLTVRRLEQLGRDGEIEASRELAGRLEGEVDELLASLEALADEEASG